MKKIFTVFCMALLMIGFMAGVVSAAAPVNLGAAGNYVILAKSAITTTGVTDINGHIGISPAASTAMTGFGLVMDSSNQFSTSSLVYGNIYAANYAAPTPANLTTAVLNMEAAYTDAAGRAPDHTNDPASGDISGMTLAPGVYKWTTPVLINGNVTLNGGPNDVWIFQTTGGITQASATSIILTGGAQATNIFWQAAGVVSLGTTAHLEGIVLSATSITLTAGATITGRLFAQTAVTLIANTIKANATPIILNAFPVGKPLSCVLLVFGLIVIGIVGSKYKKRVSMWFS